MKNFLKRFWVLVVAVLVLLSLPINTFFMEAMQSQSAEKNVIVDVNGEGEVIFEHQATPITISANSSQSFSVESNAVLKFKVTAKADYSIENASVNGTTIQNFIAKSKDFVFEHTYDKEPLHFIFDFKKDVAESDGKEQNLLLDDSTLINKTGIPSQEELAIVEDYKLGNTMKAEYVQKRKEIVERIHAQALVDENYFITDKYMDIYGSQNLLTTLGASILIYPNYTYERSIQIDESERAITNPTVNYFKESISTTINLGTYGYVYGHGAVWKVNGHPAFCGQAHNAPPKVGHTLTGLAEVTNLELKKLMYYGYQGVDDKLSAIFGNDTNKTILAMNEMVSTLNSNTALVPHSVYNYVKSKGFFNNPTPPSNFKVYKAQDPNKGTNFNGVYTQCQTLVFWEIVPQKGTLQIKKTSANPTLTNNNPCYDLKGAEYGVYKSTTDAQNDRNRVNTLIIGSNQWSNKISLGRGTYYVKETKAPKGFSLNPSIVVANVEAGQNVQKGVNGEFTDTPLADPIKILIKKVNDDTGSATSDGSLANAHFTVKYYKGYYDSDPAKQGRSPERTWVLKTDKDGFTYLDNEGKVSGDAFYYNGTNEPSIPLGTITIQETKAPDKYHLNPEVFVKKITTNPNNQWVEAYQTPICREKPVKLHLKKVAEGTGILLPNAEFTHINPDGSSEIIKTDSKGQLTLTGLSNGTHSLQESKAPDGYILNSTKIEFKVEENGKITFITDLTGTGISQEKANDGEVLVTVEDKKIPLKLKIKKTGENDILLADAKFGLFTDSSCTSSSLFDEKITNSNGELVFKNLKVNQTYYLKETKVPHGYYGKALYKIIVKLNTKNEFVWMVNDNEIQSGNDLIIEGNYKEQLLMNIKNSKIPINITINKKGDDGKLLDGTIFNLYESAYPSNNYKTVTTIDGVASFDNLKVGTTYYLEEVKATDGYIKIEHVYNIICRAVDKNTYTEYEWEIDGVVYDKSSAAYYDEIFIGGWYGDDCVFNIVNKKLPLTIYIRKLNEKDNYLKGAEFTLYRDQACTDKIESKVSDEYGDLTFENLTLNTTYYLKETKAPEGYYPSSFVYVLEAIYNEHTKEYAWNVNGNIHIQQNNGMNPDINVYYYNAHLYLNFRNYTNAKLPITGGMGATLLVIVGGLIMAIAMIINKKNKMKEEGKENETK